jgi:hypothetical protein
MAMMRPTSWIGDMADGKSESDSSSAWLGERDDRLSVGSSADGKEPVGGEVHTVQALSPPPVAQVG